MLLFYFILSFLGHTYSLKINRKVTIEWNPGCHEINCQIQNNSFLNLIYVKSLYNEDAIHFIWTTIGLPSFYLYKTTSDTYLNINWPKLLSKSSANSITFNGTTLYKYSVYFPELLEFYNNQTAPTGFSNIFRRRRDGFEGDNQDRAYPLHNVVWEDFRTTLNITSNSGTLKGYHAPSRTNVSFQEPVICLSILKSRNRLAILQKVSRSKLPYLIKLPKHSLTELSFFESDSRSQAYPHMLFTANSTEFVLVLNRSHTLYTAPQVPLLGLRAVFAEVRWPEAIAQPRSYELRPLSGPMEYFKKRSMDDEYTPGLFEMDQVVSKRHKANSGYAQWKPIYFDAPNPSYFRDSRPIITQPLRTIVVNSSSPIDPLPPFITAILEDRVFRGFGFGVDPNSSNGQDSSSTFQYTNFTFGDYRDPRMPTPVFTATPPPKAHDGTGTNGTSTRLGPNGTAELHFGQYVTWHCVIGWGESPNDRVSSFVVFLITLGFGLPLALIFFTYTYGTVRLLRVKYGKKRGICKNYGGEAEPLNVQLKSSSTQNLLSGTTDS